MAADDRQDPPTNSTMEPAEPAGKASPVEAAGASEGAPGAGNLREEQAADVSQAAPAGTTSVQVDGSNIGAMAVGQGARAENKVQITAQTVIVSDKAFSVEIARVHASSSRPHDHANGDKASKGLHARWCHETSEDDRYVGRLERVETLNHWARDLNVRVIAVTGMGGLGKTALVGQWLKHAGGATQRTFDALFFWSFYVERDPRLFLRSFVDYVKRTLGADVPSTRPPPTTVRSTSLRVLPGVASLPIPGLSQAPISEEVERAMRLFDAHPLLIVLDGLEVLQESPGQFKYGSILDPSLERFVKEVCKSAQHGLLVLTSRFPFTSLKDYVGRSLRELQLDRLTSDDGIALLAICGVHGSPDARLAVVDEFEGHPLALRIFAAVLAMQVDGDPTRFMYQVLGRSTSNSSSRLEAKLDRLLNFYERQLPPIRVSLLGLVAMFRVSVDIKAIFPLIKRLRGIKSASQNLDEHTITLEIAALCNDGLLHRERSVSGLDLLSCHPLLRDHFRRALFERDSQAAVDAAKALTERPDEQRYSNIKDLEPIFNAIDLLLIAHQIPEAESLYRHHLRDGKVAQELLAIEDALRCTLTFVEATGIPKKTSPDEDRTFYDNDRWYLHAGIFAWLGGEARLASSLLGHVSESEKSGEWALRAEAMEHYAEVLASLGQLQEAERIAREAVQLSTGQSLFASVTRRANFRLALILATMGEVRDAVAINDQAMALTMAATSHDEEDYRIGALWIEFWLRTNDPALVRSVVSPSIEIFQNNRWPIDTLRCCIYGGRAELRLGNIDLAEEYIVLAERLAREGHAFSMVPDVLLAKSELGRVRHRWREAIVATEEALDISASRGLLLQHIDALVQRSSISLSQYYEMSRQSPWLRFLSAVKDLFGWTSADVTPTTIQPFGVLIQKASDDAHHALIEARRCGYMWAERDALELLGKCAELCKDLAQRDSFLKEARVLTARLNGKDHER